MNENNNQDMSVDELLEKLRATVMGNSDPSGADAKSKSETDAELAALLETLEEKTEKAEELPEDLLVAPEFQGAFDETTYAGEKTEKPVEAAAEEKPAAPSEVEKIPEATDAPEESAIAEEPASDSPIPAFKDEDIFVAWGISKEEVETAGETKIPEMPAETPMPEETPGAPISNGKAYRISRVEKKEDYALRKQTETQAEKVDYDRTDYSLIKQALGMEKVVGEIETPAADLQVEEVSVKSGDEFTYQRQRDDIAAKYRKSKITSAWKLGWTALCGILLFCVECLPAFGITLPEFLCFDGDYRLVASMFCLQMLWFSAALSYKEIFAGARTLLHGKLISGGVLALAVVLTSICDFVACFAGAAVPTYNFPALLCALLIRVFAHMDVCREIVTFEIASSPESKKYVAIPVSPEEKQKMVVSGLEEYCDEDAKILRTERCSFVENYFARTEKNTDSEANLNRFLVPIAAVIAILAAIVAGVQSGSGFSAFSVFNGALLVGLSACVSFSSAYPLYKAAKHLERRDSAVIGETAVEEYAGTTMICFDDADAFPCFGVSLENLRIYGKSDIETVIEQMGAVYRKLGGPLRHVFTLMTAECPKPYKVKIEGVYEDGVCAGVDGSTLFIGSAAYMEANGFTVADRGDEIDGKRFSTVYLAGDGALRAKFYIRYTLDGSFETIAKKLARHGIASVILTGDSNINDELLAHFIDLSKLPVKVVRRAPSEKANLADRADSGIVSRSGVGDLAGAVTMCDRLYKIANTMKAVRIASMVICALFVAFAAVMQLFGSVSSLYVTVYYLLWLLPAWLIAKFNV